MGWTNQTGDEAVNTTGTTANQNSIRKSANQPTTFTTASQSAGGATSIQNGRAQCASAPVQFAPQKGRLQLRKQKVKMKMTTLLKKNNRGLLKMSDFDALFSNQAHTTYTTPLKAFDEDTLLGYFEHVYQELGFRVCPKCYGTVDKNGKLLTTPFFDEDFFDDEELENQKDCQHAK